MRFFPAWVTGCAALSLVAGCGGNSSSSVTVGPKVSAPTRFPELVLSRTATGNPVRHDIISATGKGSEIRVLRSDSAQGSLAVSSPAWSPDGQRIAFVAARDPTGFASDIYLMHADGSSVERLSDDGQSLNPVWAPDGKTIAFARWTPSQNASQVVVGSTLWTIGADGSNVQQLTDEQEQTYDQPGSFSPDGATLAFTRYTGPFGNASNGAIYALDLGSSETRKLADDAVDPVYSPDGTRVAFGSSRDKNGDYQFGEDEVGPAYELYVMDADGSNQRRLSETEGVNEVAPSWSSDGAELAYEWQGDSFQKAVYLMNPDGSCSKAILDGGRRTWYSEPAWRPGSKPGALHC